MEKKLRALMAKLCDCQTMCKYCFNACLEEDDVQMMTGCIKLDVECAEICGMALSALAYEGEFIAEILKVCADACERCAGECGKHRYIHCIECAKACRECAGECRTYAYAA